MKAAPRRPSLVRRLVMLAAGWSVVALAVTGVLLTTAFHQASLRRFDLGLAGVTEALLAGATVDDEGAVQAPALTDARSMRVYSGRYWQI
ncbi:MAG TPA: sensor histidine kinase, partial [Caulobacteraceae bacterium]|nr:sensor histidine kinase [Caulobacteraceae bacterium]